MSFEEQIMSKQIYEHLFVPNRDYCGFNPSNIFFATCAHSLENWGILVGYFPVLAGEYSFTWWD